MSEVLCLVNIKFMILENLTFHPCICHQQVYSDPSKRLPLRWRPEDVYCKAAFGDRVHSNSLLMRVRRRRKKSEDAKFEYQVEVLGIVNVTYKFQGMSYFRPNKKYLCLG